MKLNKKNVLFVVSILVSVACSWLFARKIDWPLLKNAMKEANYWFVIPATALTLLILLVRAIRWQGFLSHIKDVPVINLLSITSIGFMANNILPARVGEVLRPFILYKKEGVKFSTSVATVIVERIFDMLGLIIFTVAVIFLLPSPDAAHQGASVPAALHEARSAKESVIPSLKKWAEVFAGVGVLTVGALFLIVFKPDFFKLVLSRFCFFLPHTVKDKVLGFYESFVHGLKILENKLQTAWMLALSLIIWILAGAEIYLLAFSFHMELPFVGACLVAVCIALAVALPQAPGYIGVFHIAVMKSLDIFGVQTTAAQSYAIVLWAIGIFPSTLMGFLFLWREGISFREVVKLEEEIAEGKLEEAEGIPKESCPG